MIQNTEVLPPLCSDHCPIVLNLCFKVFKERSFKRIIYKYNEANWDIMNANLSSLDWETLIGNDNDVDVINDKILDTITTLTETHIPSKKIRIRPNDKPWMNSLIRNRLRKKNRIHKIARNTNKETDWLKFRNSRNEVIDLIREAKSDYLTKMQNSLSDKKYSSKKMVANSQINK